MKPRFQPAARSSLARTACAVVFALTLGSCAAMAPVKSTPGARAPKAAATEKPGAEKESPFKAWDKATKELSASEGFFRMHLGPGKVYFEIRPEQLDQEFLGVFTFARGIGSSFMLGGLPLNDRLLTFHREGNIVQLVDRNRLFTADQGSPMERATNLSLGHSVLATLKIESEHAESKALLVDMTDVFVSDLSDLAARASSALGDRPVQFDSKRSALTLTKNFPRNTEIEALLTFTPSKRGNASLYTVPDERAIPITVHYSFVELPNPPMQPRLADDRVGYFLTVKKDFSRDDQEHFFVRFVERWRLEKKDPAAALSDPVKPIVFYLDRTVPDEYRPWIKQGVELWQKAFEAAGFTNAIIAKDAPSEEEDPDWDAEDVRYSTIRWITSGGGSFNAIGPSRSDPRTGELIDADVLVEAAAIQGYRASWRTYAGAADMAADVLGEMQPDPWLPLEFICENQSAAGFDGGLMRATLTADGAMPPGSPVPDAYLEPFVVRLIMHEVGHTLGLRHNFRSSTATPFDKLHDVAWTSAHGLMGSVMDYVTPNIALDRSKQGEYFITSPGTYDLFAIRYGYTPSGETERERDLAFAKRIADESTMPGHEYGTDEDAGAPNALDPRTARWDLSDDPLRWADERTGYVRDLWQNGGLERRILGDDGDYATLRRAMDTLLGLYTRTAFYATRYIGGQYHVRDHRGQPGAQQPLTPVSAEDQRHAAKFLAERVFAADAFDVSPELLNRLAPDRWTHWGQPNAFAPDARVEYDYFGRSLALQRIVLAEVLDPLLLNRLREAENRGPSPYTLAEHLGGLTRTLWAEVDGRAGAALAKLDGPTSRRDLQRAYVDMLGDLVLNPPPGTPDDARALARLELTRIDDRARRTETLGGLGDYTRAHLLETRARIARTLAATRTAG